MKKLSTLILALTLAFSAQAAQVDTKEDGRRVGSGCCIP